MVTQRTRHRNQKARYEAEEQPRFPLQPNQDKGVCTFLVFSKDMVVVSWWMGVKARCWWRDMNEREQESGQSRACLVLRAHQMVISVHLPGHSSTQTFSRTHSCSTWRLYPRACYTSSCLDGVLIAPGADRQEYMPHVYLSKEHHPFVGGSIAVPAASRWPLKMERGEVTLWLLLD